MALPKCCSQFMAFFLFGIIFVPTAVFLIGAFFGAILMAIECGEAQADPETLDVALMCSFYEWWKYVLGNLTGVVLTNVSPASGHVVTEVMDLLIAIWSLTVAGLVIGIVGSLAWVNSVAEATDSGLQSRVSKALARFTKEARARAQDGDGLDFASFMQLCADKGVKVGPAALRQLFNEADSNQNGVVDAGEVEKLLEEVTKQSAAALGLTPSDAPLANRMDALELKMDALLGLVREFRVEYSTSMASAAGASHQSSCLTA